MHKLRQGHIFWILQFLGWGSLSAFSIVMAGITENSTAAGVIFFGAVTVGICMTSLLRWYYKKYIDLDDLTLWSFVKIALGMLVVTILLPTVTYYTGYVLGIVSRFFIEDDGKPLLNISLRAPLIRYLGHFIIIFGWTVLYFSLKALRKLNRKRIARLKLRDNVKQAQLNTLKGNINPQFMFTSLNNIKGLMLEDVSQSREMLTKLSEMLRYSLTKNNINAISLEEELEMVGNYIDLSRIQYNDRLEFIKDIQVDQRIVSVPPMLVHNMIENATKNGVFQLQEGGKVVLTITANDVLTLKVNHTGNHIENKAYAFETKKIQQRLRLLYKEDASFSLKKREEGTSMSIILPLNAISKEDGL